MSATVAQINAISATSEFSVPPHDTKLWTYSGSNLTRIDYLAGGETGRLVAHVIYTYGGTAPAGSPFKAELFVP